MDPPFAERFFSLTVPNKAFVKVDVLVVGASPAGLQSAITAAKAGAKTALIERDCNSLSHPANTVFKGMADRAGMEIEDRYIRHRLKGMTIISPGGRELEIEAEGYFLDREALDKDLIKKAQSLGAQIMKGEAISCTHEGDYRIVSTTGGKIRALVVIDAGGVESGLESITGLSPMRHPQDIAWAAEAEVELSGLGQEERFLYWVGSIAPGWKATFSPGGRDVATLGVFVRHHGRNVHAFLDRFLKVFREKKAKEYGDMSRMRVVRIRTGGDPIAVIPGRIVGDGLMVTGGAAGQSGLVYSIRAGAICGQVAAKSALCKDTSRSRLSEYERMWWRDLGNEYLLGRAALNTMQGMEDRELDRLVGSLRGRVDVTGASLRVNALRAGITVASVSPGLIPSLIGNILRG